MYLTQQHAKLAIEVVVASDGLSESPYAGCSAAGDSQVLRCEAVCSKDVQSHLEEL